MSDEKVKNGESGQIRFFSETDLRTDEKGNITGRNCDYPRWYFPKIINDKKEEIRQKKFAIESGTYPQGRLQEAKESLRAAEKQLAKLEESQPEFSRYKDVLAGCADELGAKIAETMPTLSQMKRGLDDPHKLVQVDTTPCIEVTSAKVANLAAVNGFKITNKKMTGGDAVKLWQLCRTAIGESGNPEWLRRE